MLYNRWISLNFYDQNIQEDCEVDGDVNNRIQAGWFKWRKAFGVICDRKV